MAARIFLVLFGIAAAAAGCSSTPKKPEVLAAVEDALAEAIEESAPTVPLELHLRIPDMCHAEPPAELDPDDPDAGYDLLRTLGLRVDMAEGMLSEARSGGLDTLWRVAAHQSRLADMEAEGIRTVPSRIRLGIRVPAGVLDCLREVDPVLHASLAELPGFPDHMPKEAS